MTHIKAKGITNNGWHETTTIMLMIGLITLPWICECFSFRVSEFISYFLSRLTDTLALVLAIKRAIVNWSKKNIRIHTHMLFWLFFCYTYIMFSFTFARKFRNELDYTRFGVVSPLHKPSFRSCVWVMRCAMNEDENEICNVNRVHACTPPKVLMLKTSIITSMLAMATWHIVRERIRSAIDLPAWQ